LNVRLGARPRKINLFELRQRNRLLTAAKTAEQHDDTARTDRLHPAVVVAVVVRNDRAVGIVLLTAHDEFALSAFDLEALNYLLSRLTMRDLQLV
jgi:DNA-binding LytR/AlgR family response regulator